MDPPSTSEPTAPFTRLAPWVRLNVPLDAAFRTEASRMRKAIVRWAPWAVGGVSIALMTGNLVLLFVHRAARLPAGYAEGWDIGGVLNNMVNMAVPAIGIVPASRRPRTGSAGCSWGRDSRSACLGSEPPTRFRP
jgi:hypothetical protein